MKVFKQLIGTYGPLIGAIFLAICINILNNYIYWKTSHNLPATIGCMAMSIALLLIFIGWMISTCRKLADKEKNDNQSTSK